MNQHRSIAEEKDALLARMEASRVAYRRMLQGPDDAAATRDAAREAHTFPRSKTLRWIRDHPILIALAVGALVIGPRRVARTTIQGGKSVANTVARNRNRFRIAFGVATTIARFAANRRR